MYVNTYNLYTQYTPTPIHTCVHDTLFINIVSDRSRQADVLYTLRVIMLYALAARARGWTGQDDRVKSSAKLARRRDEQVAARLLLIPPPSVRPWQYDRPNPVGFTTSRRAEQVKTVGRQFISLLLFYFSLNLYVNVKNICVAILFVFNNNHDNDVCVITR